MANFIKSFHPYDEFVFILFQILQVVFAPIPGEVTGLIGGYLYGPVLGTIYSTVGLTVGSWLAFMLARFLGLPFVEKAVNPEILKKYDYVMEHQGAIVSFILFLIPGFPKDYLCYIMGLSHMKLWTFLIISTVGRLFGTMLLSMSGSYVRSNHYVGLLVLLGAGGVFVLLAYLYRERWIDMLRRKERP
ncbi:MAG: TVP38/TMEM64 family protein [Nitrospirota bacterium]